MNDRIELFAEESDEGKRLDVFLKAYELFEIEAGGTDPGRKRCGGLEGDPEAL